MEVIFVMSELKKYIISVEVFKYPYCAKSIESYEFLSEKICCYTIKIRKKIVRKTKRVFVYGQLIFSLNTGLAPTQAIGLPILSTTPSVMRSIHSNIKKTPNCSGYTAEIDFTQKEMNELYRLSVEYKNNSLSKEELITQISNLRGGSFIDVVAALGVIGGIIILLINDWGLAFQPNPHLIVPPHLQWLYGNNYQPGQFGYGKSAGQRSITVTGMTRNSGSDKKYPSSGSWDYVDVMKELAKQSSNNSKVGDQIYMFKNTYSQNADELQFILAEKIYDSIRECDTDICDVAENLGFKVDNIKNVKDHVFYNKHDLDRYGPDEIEHKRFDATLEQALAWKRLETGTFTQDDVIWIKHECAERHHELKYDSGYTEAHERAQSRYEGYPWENKF